MTCTTTWSLSKFHVIQARSTWSWTLFPRNTPPVPDGSSSFTLPLTYESRLKWQGSSVDRLPDLSHWRIPCRDVGCCDQTNAEFVFIRIEVPHRMHTKFPGSFAEWYNVRYVIDDLEKLSSRRRRFLWFTMFLQHSSVRKAFHMQISLSRLTTKRLAHFAVTRLGAVCHGDWKNHRHASRSSVSKWQDAWELRQLQRPNAVLW